MNQTPLLPASALWPAVKNDALAERRLAEAAKYERAYQRPRYHMGAQRMQQSAAILESLPCRGGYLDVSCGCGEMLDHARRLGFHPVAGTEIVPALLNQRVLPAWAHELPFADRQFDVVTCFDVLEHLLPGDDQLACREMARVAAWHVILTVNNLSSKQPNGDELHINRRPYEEWHALFQDWFAGAKIQRFPPQYVSQAWRIDLSKAAQA